MIRTTSRGSTVISFLVQLVPEEDDAVFNVEENDDDFVLSSRRRSRDLGSDETRRPPQIPNRLTVPDCVVTISVCQNNKISVLNVNELSSTSYKTQSMMISA